MVNVSYCFCRKFPVSLILNNSTGCTNSFGSFHNYSLKDVAAGPLIPELFLIIKNWTFNITTVISSSHNQSGIENRFKAIIMAKGQ